MSGMSARHAQHRKTMRPSGRLRKARGATATLTGSVAEIERMRETLPEALGALLTLHHSLYRSPAKDTQLEELLSLAMSKAGFDNTWSSGSHAASVDIKLDTGTTFSAKSGSIKNGVLDFNGSRLGGSSDSLAAMLASVKTSTAEYYICLARDKDDWKTLPGRSEDKVYNLCIFPAKLLDYGHDTDWVMHHTSTTPSKRVYEYKPSAAVIVKADIVESKSHQLWTWVRVSKLPEPIRIVVPGVLN